MADLPPYPDTGVGSDRGATTGIARWQKVVGVIGLVVFLGLGILLLTGGDHGPGMHTPPSSMIEHGVQQP